MSHKSLRIITVRSFLAILVLGGTTRALGQDLTASARRLAAAAQLAADEYHLGVSGGKIIAQPEVDEAKLFLAEARRNALRLPNPVGGKAIDALDHLDAMVTRVAEPDSVALGVAALVDGLTRGLNIALDEIPSEAPSLARGREVYEANCAGCHGAAGRGDGPQGAGLTPRPANLADGAALLGSSPVDFYRRITVGAAGTAMVPFEHVLLPADRWAVAVYGSVLRLPAPVGQVPEALRSFPATARMSDAELLRALGPGATSASVAAVRTGQARQTGVAASASIFTEMRRQLDSAYALAHAGRAEDARAMAMDAYITFEQVERELRARDPVLTQRIEAAFSSLRTRAGAGATVAQLGEIRQELARGLEHAERALVDQLSPTNLFVQSFIILVREGLEAILVIGALMAFLVRTGNGHRRRDIHLGVGAALGMSLLTAAALETVFALSRSHQEGLEGAVMLLAGATLFYVSYWLLSKLEVAKWNRFVRAKMENALTRGSALALASVAFLAVYREGFETVLFYKALAVSGGAGGAAWAPVAAGILVGGVVLAGVYLAIHRFGVRLPLKPLFGATSALLYYMAFVFAGKGIMELQGAGAIALTPVVWAPRIPIMGIYPSVESLAVQGLLVVLAVVALVWIFFVQPRRLNLTSVLVPEPDPTARVGGEVSKLASRPGDAELLRSIDRIEVDLAEVRSELERMKKQVTPDESDVRRKK